VVVDEVARRNRRRIAVVTFASVLNHWLSIGVILAIPAVFLAYSGGNDHRLILLVTIMISATLAVIWVPTQTGAVRRRVVRAVGGVEVGATEVPRVHNLMAELAIATGTPPVTLALVDDAAPNAMAVGRRPRETTVIVTSGLVDKLSRDQLEAVLAVEMCAIRRFDTALRSVAMASTAGAFQIHNMLRGDLGPGRPWYERWDWSAWLGVFLTWPTMLFGALIRRSAQRSADFGADEMAIAITRHPEALLSALKTLQSDHTVLTAPRHPVALAPWIPTIGPSWIKPVPEEETYIPHEVRALISRPDLQERLERLTDIVGTHSPLPAPG
jgi:heat shock protein HtpX